MTQRVTGVSLRAGLNLMLDSLACTWLVEDEVLKVISQPEAKMRPAVRVYCIGDLVTKSEPIDKVAKMVRTLLKQPEKVHRRDRRQVLSFADTLVVADTETGHQKLGKLLTQLRDEKK